MKGKKSRENNEQRWINDEPVMYDYHDGRRFVLRDGGVLGHGIMGF